MIPKGVNNLFEAGAGADDQPNHGNHSDDTVLHNHPGLGESVRFVPVRARLDERREGDTQRGQTERPEQRDEQLQVRDGHGEQDWEGKKWEFSWDFAIICSIFFI